MEAEYRSVKPVLKEITVRCYAGLNDFLLPDRRQKEFTMMVKLPVIAEEIIESLGIPLAEVDLLLIGGGPSPFSRRLYEHDHISVFPAFERFDISSLTQISKVALGHTRFILDAHLGKLARYLRMLGFDTLYRNDFGDNEIIEIAARDRRIILSRDKLLLKSGRVTHGYFVRTTLKHEQLREIVEKFDLMSQFRSFTRCMTCNTELVRKKREELGGRTDKEILNLYSEFFYCPACDKVFWKGSHFLRMEKLIISLASGYNREQEE